MVKLRPMKENEFKKFLQCSSENYARQQIKSRKWTQKDADSWLSDKFQEELPQGKDTPNHHFFRILNIQDMPVGYLWIIVKDHPHEKIAFINDIVIDEKHRRKGLALACLHYLEKWCVDKNIHHILLHLFPQNQEALHLYDRAGYCRKNDLSDIWIKHLL